MTSLARLTTVLCSLLFVGLAVPAIADVSIDVQYGGEPVELTAATAPQVLADGGLIVPAYRIETADNGDTTLYAVRNNSDAPVTVRISYYNYLNGDAAIKVEQVEIAAHAVRTANIRDVDGLPITASGVGAGFVVVEPLGQVSPDAISGDYFRVSPDGAAANGGNMIDTDVTTCRQWSHRFFNGGAFDGGTRISFLSLDGETTGATVSGNVYNEAGDFMATVALTSPLALFEVDTQTLGLPNNFGSIDWLFEGDGHGYVSTTFTANSLFSVGTEATCVEDTDTNEPAPDGSVVFELPGTFLTCNNCGNWQYDMPLDAQRQFSKIVIDFDVFIAGWDPNRPRGFHCVFWLNNGNRWQDMLGYMNTRGISNRTVFQSNGPFGNPIGVERYRTPGPLVGTTYHVHWEYDTVEKAVWYEWRTPDGDVWVSDYITMPSFTQPVNTNYTFIQFGTQPNGSVESRTPGWRWSNFRAQFIP